MSWRRKVRQQEAKEGRKEGRKVLSAKVSPDIVTTASETGVDLTGGGGEESL